MHERTARHVVFVTWKKGNAQAFAAARRLGHHVTLIRSLRMEETQHIDFDATPYRQYVDAVVTLADATDIAALRACVHAIHAERPIDGFIATVDALVVPVAEIAEEIGVPFTASRGARQAKQKNECRDVLAAAGLDSTMHAIVAGLDDARAFAARAGFPVVVKPARSSASEGVHVAADDRELARALGQAAGDPATYASGILIEQYLRGTFVSAEIALSRGRVLPLAVTDRKTWCRHEPLELGTTIPAAIDPAMHATVMSYAGRVIRALDLRLGIFHVEIMVGEDGIARLIELNPRVMGSCLPNLFCLATGADFFELLVRLYLDEPVEVGHIRFTRYATVRWFGAAERTARPAAMPDLSWAERYRPALHAVSVAFPDSPVLEACRGNLGSFGEVQVVHEEYASSVGIAEEIVERIANQLQIEVTR